MKEYRDISNFIYNFDSKKFKVFPKKIKLKKEKHKENNSKRNSSKRGENEEKFYIKGKKLQKKSIRKTKLF